MTGFTDHIRSHVDAEIRLALSAEALGNFDTARTHLERAHVLGQRSTFHHVRIHWLMLCMAIRNGWTGKAAGQLWRTCAAAAFTPLGLLPRRNLGSDRVSGCRLAAIFTCVVFTGCMTPPPNLDLSREKASSAGHYKVAIVAPNPAPAVNQLHAWKVKLAAADGHPIKGAEFTVDGGMPQHGHGFPTKPRVTREVEEGTYLLEGMKFSMTGWWDLKLGIRGSEGLDTATFNIVVDPTAQK